MSRLVALLTLLLLAVSAAPSSAAKTTATRQWSPRPSSVPIDVNQVQAAAEQPGITWHLMSDFRLYPEQENPSRDSYGNPAVWYYLRGTLDRNSQGYSLLSNFDQNWKDNLDWQAWNLGSSVWRLGPAALSDPTQIDRIHVHPYINTTVAVGWQSPIDGVISISGRVTDSDCGGSDGVSWFIDKGATPLASGGVNCTEQLFSDGSGSENLTYVAVRSGEFIYFVVHPRSSTNWDTTLLDITIASLGPSLTVSPSSIPADDQTTAALLLGGASSGHQVLLHSSLPGSSLSPMSGRVGADGRFSATIRSSTAGTAIITVEDLTDRQTFGASASVTFTALEGNAQPLPAQAGEIVITDVKGDCGQISCPKDGFFMLGLDGLHLPLLAVVDWKGSPPGTVEFTLNDHTDSIPANIRYDLDINQRLREGSNILRVVARSGEKSSLPIDLNLQGYRLPQWIMDGVNALPTIGDRALVLQIALPGQPLSKQNPIAWGFPGDLNHFQWQTNIKLELPTRGGAFVTEISRERDHARTGRKPTAFLKLLGHEFDIAYKGRLSGVLGQTSPYVIAQELEVSAGISTSWEKSAGIVEALNCLLPFGPYAYGAIAAVPPLHDWLNDRGEVYIQVTPELSGDFSLGFQPAFHVAGTQLTLDFPLEVGARSDLWVAEGNIYGGLGGKATFGYSADDLFIASLQARGFGGYKFRLAWFVLEDQGDWKLAEWPSASSMFGLGYDSASSQEAGWQLIAHVRPQNYAVFRAPAEREQAFVRRLDGALSDERGSSAAATILISNAYTYTEPFLAVNPVTDQALLLWVHDDIAKPVGQAHEIEFSRWDGATWSTPTGVTDDDLLDGAPQVAWASDGNAVAVWQRLDETLGSDATWDSTTAKKIEIATAAYDPVAETWSPVSLLTDNDALDMAPVLTRGSNGSLLAAWRQNDAGLLYGSTTDADKIMTATYSDGWSPAAVAVEGIPGLADLAIGQGDRTATIAFTRNIISTGSITPTLQLLTSTWNGTAWSAPLQLTDDALGHTDPQIIYNAANQPLLVWLAGKTLTLRNLASSVERNLLLPEEIGGVDEFRVVQDATGNLAAVFTAQGSQRDLYVALYDQLHDMWGNPLPLTTDRAHEGYPAPALDSTGRLLMGYASTAITSEEHTTTDPETSEVITYTLPVEGQTDLVTLSHTFTRNLSLSDAGLAVSETHPAAGSTISISATITNTADLALSGVAVDFYDGDPSADGILIGTDSLPTPLAGGMAATLTTAYTIPETGGVRTLFAVADPEDAITEADETDNTAALAAFGPDLVLEATGVDLWGGSDVGLTAVVRNTGTTASPAATLAFYRESTAGTLVASDVLPAIAIGGMVTVTVPWNYGPLSEGSHPLVAAANLDGTDFIEIDTSNNTAELTLDVLPDLSVSPLYVWGVPLPDGRMAITVSVANLGSVAAPTSEVDIYVDGVFTDTARLTTLLVPALDPAGQVILETNWDPTGPGEHTVYAVVNPRRAITETTWANNVASTAGAAPLSDLAASRSGSDALLMWTHLGSSVTSYEIWRSTTDPYFEPGDDLSELVGEALPPNSGSQVSYPDASAFGTAGTSYFYTIVPISASGIPYPPSNRVAAFNFALAPGTAQ